MSYEEVKLEGGGEMTKYISSVPAKGKMSPGYVETVEKGDRHNNQSPIEAFLQNSGNTNVE